MQERKEAKAIRWAALFVLLGVACPAIPSFRNAPEQPTPLAVHEAEILIYLLPQAQDVHREGWEIGWELQTSPGLNQDEFYYFWVYNAKRPSNGSVTIGYFAINKYSADVWNEDLDHRTSGGELDGVQRILRRAHLMSDAVLQSHSSIDPHARHQAK
jgi:hypothetical protein